MFWHGDIGRLDEKDLIIENDDSVIFRGGVLYRAPSALLGSYASITSISSDYTLLTTDCFIVVDASSVAVEVSLPSASEVAGKIYNVKKNNNTGFDVTITPNGSDTIDGNGDLILSGSSKPSVSIISTGGEWLIL